MLIPQRAFSSGELSPSLYARVDYFRYATGAKIIKNCYVKKSGGVENRGGNRFIFNFQSETNTYPLGSLDDVRMIPFTSSLSSAYVLLFTHQKMFVVKNGSMVFSTASSSVSINSSCVVTYSGSDTYANGDIVYFETTDQASYSNSSNYHNRYFIVSSVNTGANTFSLTYMDGTAVTGLGAVTAINMKEVYSISSPYSSSDLPNIKYAQSKGTLTITHPTYAEREITTAGDASWTISTITKTPTQAAPTSPSATQNGTTGSAVYNYKLAAINDNTKEESLPTAAFGVTNGNATLDTTNYVGISATAASGATEYVVYKELNQSGTYGFIGFLTSGSSFRDIGYTPDTTDRPIDSRDPFGSANNYPSCVVYYQQRRGFANTNNDTEIVEFSRTAFPNNFTVSKPSQSNDAVSFTASGARANPVRHMVDLGSLVLFTDSGEKIVQGDNAGVLSPTSINLRQFSYNGSANNPAPIIIDNTALYIQAGGSIVRDFFADIAVDGYKGNDLTIFSNHLFDGYNITDWAYQKSPNSIIWAVRSDGVVLSLTYVKDQQMLAWTQHNFDGFVQNVCCIPNGDIDDVYFVIERKVASYSGGEKIFERYLERLSDRIILNNDFTIVNERGDTSSALAKPIRYYSSNDNEKIFSDSSVFYDLRNTDRNAILRITQIASNGYSAGTEVSVQIFNGPPASFFTQSIVGTNLHFWLPNGDFYVLENIQSVSYSSGVTFTAVINRDLPSAYQTGNITSNFAYTRKTFYGLWHLEGKEVSVRGDGYVVASPNNEQYETVTVANGSITLDRCYSVVSIGLPYTSDIQTLAIDGTQNTTIGKQQMIKKVYVHTEKTQTMWVGTRNPDNVKLNSADDPLYGLYEVKNRNEENYDEVAGFLKERFEVKVEGTYEEQAEVFIRNVDPTSMTVLAITPEGVLNFS
jgi:hypothetical protein